MMDVRKLSESGLEKVVTQLDSLVLESRKGARGTPISSADINMIMELAHENSYLAPERVGVTIDAAMQFESSFELGKYLHTKFGHMDTGVSQPGLWTWISLIYFNQLLQKNREGFLIGSSYRYVLKHDNQLRYYRHLVFMPYYLYSRLGDKSYIFLHSPPSVSGEFLAQAQKEAVLSNRNLAEMCEKYYFDRETGRFAPGFTGKNSDPRSLRRLVEALVPQLSVNYDIRYCNADQLYDLLPADFRQNSLRRPEANGQFER